MIKLIVLDVDGCLTDGKIIYSNSGEETKAFNVKDGLAIRSWQDLGHEVAIITGRRSQLVEKRATELGITMLHQGIKDKATLLKEICETRAIALRDVAAIGDDLNDYNMLSIVGHSFTPNNGSRHIKAMVNTVCETLGGEGAVREMIELLIVNNDEEDDFLALWQ